MAQFQLENPPIVALARNIGGLTFDAVISESHESELQVTENQVESGVEIADHCFMRQLRVTIEAVVSDLKLPSSSNQYDGSPSGRVRAAFQMLTELQTDLADGVADPFSVSTGLKQYDDMVCTRISARQDVTSASILAFTAELAQVKFVETQYATYIKPKQKPAPQKPTRQASEPKQGGTQQPQQTDEKQKSKLNRSFQYIENKTGIDLGPLSKMTQKPETPAPQQHASFTSYFER